VHGWNGKAVGSTDKEVSMPFKVFFGKYWYCFAMSAIGFVLTMVGMHLVDNLAIHITGFVLLYSPWVVHSWGGDLYEMLTNQKPTGDAVRRVVGGGRGIHAK
jgi:hypothetical protein